MMISDGIITGITKLSKGKCIEIKKYPNRRLYNTQESRYITLEDLAQLVKVDKDFKVIDVKTQEDVTRVTLTQIILNHELEGYNVMPIELIKQIIKLYDNPMNKVFGEFMINSMNQFNSSMVMYKNLFDQGSTPQNPIEWQNYIQKINENNASFFMDIINNFTGSKTNK
jgi:polyhydroxyalkanoate synthesis repressor PhaR